MGFFNKLNNQVEIEGNAKWIENEVRSRVSGTMSEFRSEIPNDQKAFLRSIGEVAPLLAAQCVREGIPADVAGTFGGLFFTNQLAKSCPQVDLSPSLETLRSDLAGWESKCQAVFDRSFGRK